MAERAGPASDRTAFQGKHYGSLMADLDAATFLTGANAEFIGDLHARFLDDPGSVDPSWRRFFAELKDDQAAVVAELRGPSWGRPVPFGDGAAAPAAVECQYSGGSRCLLAIRPRVSCWVRPPGLRCLPFASSPRPRRSSG